MKTVASLSGDELRELYRELILDHARAPRHFGKLPSATHSAEGINPLCGDKLALYLDCDEQTIRDAAFEGSGCAISVASASLLTDTVIGLSREDAIEWFQRVNSSLTTTTTDSNLDKLNALLGVREFPSRVKCATLAWHALNAALGQQHAIATTE